MRDFRLENHLFWPHMRNTTYGTFFEQITGRELGSSDTPTLAGSLGSLSRESIKHPILDLENDVSRVLAEMEVRGIYIDRSILENLEKELTQKILEIEKLVNEEIQKSNHGTLNIEHGTLNMSSPLQLQKLLFETMKITPLRKTKTGWSVDEETLQIIAETHPIGGMILEHRHANKLLGTYVRGLLRHINVDTHRIHTTYDTLGAATGRLSSDEPNLQNIPAGDPWSDTIKGAFRPSQEDWSFVVGDYSQIELRILACLSGDETMLQVFRDGRDLHTETAKFLMGREEITSAERKLAKTVNFGVMYGITPFGLSKMIPKTPAECGLMIDQFFTLYPRTREYFDHVVTETLRLGYSETFFGRRRAIGGLSDRNSIVRESAKREAMNMPIQGTCADIVKYAMVGISREFKKQHIGARLLLSIHDELVVECPDSEVPTVVQIMSHIMEHIVEWDIPMSVEIGVGKNWKTAKK